MKEITYSKAINEALLQSMEKDERVILLGEDIGVYGGIFQVTAGLLDRFGPERVMDMPISESGFVGAAVGAALTGMRPVVELMFIDFCTVCMDMIVNQMAKMHYMFGGRGRVPMVLRVPSGAGRGAAAQHSQSLHAFFAHIPGIYIACPSNAYDAKGLMMEAIRNDNPVVFAEHKLLYNEKVPVPSDPYTLPFGRAEIKREGKDITIVATQAMVMRSLNAAEIVEKDGIEVEIIDPRTIKPLDRETIFESVRKTGRLIVADEGHKTCGVAAEISAMIVEDEMFSLKAPVRRVCSPDTPVPYSPTLEKAYVPGTKDLIPAIKELMEYR